MSKSVYLLNLDDELNLTKNSNKKLIHLDVYSKKAAKFIVDALNDKIRNSPKKWRPYRYYREDDSDSVRGGGLFIKANADIYMTPINEVCIMFGDSWRIGNYCRAAYSNTEIEKSIKTKLALLLKNYWKDAGGDNEGKLPLHNKLKSEDNNEDVNNSYITEAEYSCLYNFLKDREINKKFKQEVIDNIIGKKIQDQFILSAIEVIKNEIAQKKNEMAKCLTECNDEYQTKVNGIRNEWETAANTIKEKYNTMIDELKGNMNSLLGIN